MKFVMSSIMDKGASIKAKLFRPRLDQIKALFEELQFPEYQYLRLRLIVTNLTISMTLIGASKNEYNIEIKYPLNEFKEVGLSEKMSFLPGLYLMR